MSVINEAPLKKRTAAILNRGLESQKTSFLTPRSNQKKGLKILIIGSEGDKYHFRDASKKTPKNPQILIISYENY